MDDFTYKKWASYRRRILDFLLEKYKGYYKGIVLDIGGRERGKFIKPKDKVKKWIFADINKNYDPDIILDVTDMRQLDSNSIDVISAIELFEHVLDIKKGLKECHRVLKKDGFIIISVPFLYQIHGDPVDFQRWTSTKWQVELKESCFKIDHFIIMGKFFTHLAEMLKYMIKGVIPRFLNLILPFLNLIVKFDNKSIVRKNTNLNNYHCGYFIIAQKLSN